MLHLGINLLKKEKDCYLTRENYASKEDDAVSTVVFIDWILHNKFYLLYPIELSSKYLQNVKSFYAQQDILTPKQEERYYKVCVALDEINSIKNKSGEENGTSLEVQFEDEQFQMNKTMYTQDVLLRIYNRYNFGKSIEGKFYSSNYCEQLYKNAMKNFDLNIKYFDRCDKQEFEKALQAFINKNPKFVEVTDLNSYDYKGGYYLMVLDKYKQVYIGTTRNIKQRILQHWQKRKHLDRLVFPNGAVEASIMSIDSFRHMDTTRIFVYITNKTYIKEDKFIRDFGKDFVLNRIGGGEMILGGLQVALSTKHRDFTKV